MPEILAWSGPPKIDVICDEDGSLMLEAVRVAAGQLIVTPRSWSDLDRQDKPPHAQLRQLFRRLKTALHAWSEAMDHLTPEPPRPRRR